MAKVTKRVGRPLGRGGIPKLPLSSFRTVKPAIAKYYKNRFIYDELNPLPLQLGAVAWWQFFGSEASSDIIEGATSTDVAGWKDSSKVTNVEVSGDIVTNGSFDTDSDWVKGAGWVISGGSATYSGPNGDDYLRQTGLSWTDGKPYILELDVLQNSGSGSNDILFGTSNIVSQGNLAVGHHKIIGFKGGTNDTLFIRARDNETFEIDNVKIYELDPATVAYNLSQNTAASQPTFTQPNGPVVFTNDYLEGVPNKTGDFTYAIKYKFNAETAAEILLGESTSENNILALLPVDDKIRVRPSNGVSMDFSVTQTPTVEYVLILTRSGNDYTCYMDGVSLGTQVNTSDFRPEWLCGRQSLNTLLSGDLYEVSYYDRSLNSAEIAKLNADMG